MTMLIPYFASKLQNLSTSDHASVVSMNIFVALLCACIVIGHLLEENRWMNEFQVKKKQFFRNFATIMLFGAVGVTQIFKKLDIGSLDIGDYIAIGAIFAATDSVCTLQVLNQDETPLLYSLVFGEGVVNDATSVVLFNAIQGFDLDRLNVKIGLDFIGNFFYLFVSSTMLGVITGLFSAFIIKKLYFGRMLVNNFVCTIANLQISQLHIVVPSGILLWMLSQAQKHSTDREFALMMLMAYLSYILAELFYLSGILTVFFCGIVMSHYTWHNVTESSRVTTKHAFATLSFVAETFIFLYVGMDALDIEKWRFVSDSPKTSVAVSSILLALVMVGRAAFVFPLSFLSNLAKKNPVDKISIRQQVVIWWAGLMRGAVSMALAYNQFTRAGHTTLRANAIMITSTITVVLVSTVVFGMMTKPLIRLLLPQPKQTSSLSLPDLSTPKSITVPLLEGEQQDSFIDITGPGAARPNSIRALLTTPTHTVHYYWRKFDNAFMRPVFGGRGFVPFVPGSPTERSVPSGSPFENERGEEEEHQQ
ncbi:hypothetical protein ACFE04_005660 [Oxalis oulophora]